jgi:hypothetical protein
MTGRINTKLHMADYISPIIIAYPEVSHYNPSTTLNNFTMTAPKNSIKGKDDRIPIRPYKLSELANMYGIDRRTFRGWLQQHCKSLGTRLGQYFSVIQVRKIFKKIGAPGGSTDK